MNSSAAFRKRHERIDWRKLASVDVDSIMRDLNVGVLQDNLANIAFSNIEQEIDVQRVDPNFLKLFKMAQLMIEYLLYSQDFLTSEMQRREAEVETLQEKLSVSEKEVEKLRLEVAEIKKECHKRKKLLAMQQHLLHNNSIQQGGSGLSGDRNQCPFCSKRMINEDFLDAHVAKHHQERLMTYLALRGKPSSLPIVAPVDDKAQELAELRAKLLQKEAELSSIRVQQQLETDRKTVAGLNQEIENRLRESERAHEREMQKVRDEMSIELRELSNKLQLTEKYLVELRMNAAETQMQSQKSLEASFTKISNLGELRDDEVAKLKELHETELRELKATMKQQWEEVNRALKAESEDRLRNAQESERLRETYEQQIAKMRNDLQQYQERLKKKDDELKLMVDAIKKRKKNEQQRMKNERELRASLERAKAEAEAAAEAAKTSNAKPKPVELEVVEDEISKKTAEVAAAEREPDNADEVDDTPIDLPTLSTGQFDVDPEPEPEPESERKLSPFDGLISHVGLLQQTGYRLPTAINQNSQFIRAERSRAEQKLSELLAQRCDIAPQTARITSPILHDRRELLRGERENLNKLAGFEQLRSSAAQRVNAIALAKLKRTPLQLSLPLDLDDSVTDETSMQLGGTLTLGSSRVNNSLPVTYSSTPQVKRARLSEQVRGEQPAVPIYSQPVRRAPLSDANSNRTPVVPARDNLRASQLSNSNSESATPRVTWRDLVDADAASDNEASESEMPKSARQTPQAATRRDAGNAAAREQTIGDDDDFSSLTELSENANDKATSGRPPQGSGAQLAFVPGSSGTKTNAAQRGSSAMDSFISETNTFPTDQWDMSSKAVSTVNPLAQQAATAASNRLVAASQQQALQASKDPTEWDVSDFDDE